MNFRLPSYKTFALSLLCFIAIFLLFSYLVLPGIIQTQAEKYITEKSGHHLSMDKPQFNPFKISLRLSNVHLTQPDGEPLMAFRELIVNLSASSIFHRAMIFDDIRLDGLDATAILLPGGKLNWSGLADALKGKEKTSESTMPRFDIEHLVLSDASLNFADKRITPVFSTRITPINLDLTDISSLPNDSGQYKFSAHTSFGAQISWQGDATIEPLALKGDFSIEHANLGSLSLYLKGMSIVPTKGLVSLSSDYQLSYIKGKPEVNLERLKAKLTGLVLEQRKGPALSIGSIDANDGSYDLAKNDFTLGSFDITDSRLNLRQDKKTSPDAIELGGFSVKNINVDLSTQQANVDSIVLKNGSVNATRDAKGLIDLANAFKFSSDKANDKTTANAAWHYQIAKLELTGFDANFRDETVAPAAQISLENIVLGAEGISDVWNKPLPLHAAFKAKAGGSFEAEGSIIPALPSADIKLKLSGLNITPAQPYLFALARLKLANGQLSTAGHATYNAHGFGYQGNFALQDLNIKESDTGDLFLAWKSLNSRSFKVNMSSLDVGELNLSGLNTKLIINKDKSVSFKNILRQTSTPSKTSTVAKPFAVNIDRMKFDHGEMDYADYSLSMPFGTRIHDLRGTITNLSSRPGSIAELGLDGQVDDYGIARATGQLDLFNPTDSMDIKVIFRNLEMARLTPYSATFAGRKITSGKLSLDLEYKIHQRQLQGSNQIVMDQLTLGERVASPQARDLPLDMAIAILQDSDGRIDLGLPMSGSLDDPQFSYGSIIWKAIENVISKIVTAPFRALGALFGSSDKFENIVFEAGNAQLSPPEREKLVQLAGALAKRPALSLSVQGVYADSDKVALQDRIMRRAVSEKVGLQLAANEDPGPLAMHQPKIQSALEAIFSDKFGSAELTAYKTGFNQANPGGLKESAASKAMARLTGLFQEKRTLSEQQVSQMKGADFYVLLFNRLRDNVVVDNNRLQALATARGAATIAALEAAGAPAERLSVLAATRIDANGQNVPIKLVLGASTKPTNK